METALRALILAFAGMPPAARVNWGLHPQGAAYPALVLNVASDRGGHHMQGPDGLFKGRVQIDCYGMTYGAAKALSEALRVPLDGYRGGRFQGVFLDTVRDTNETGDTARPFRVSLDFMVNYER